MQLPQQQTTANSERRMGILKRTQLGKALERQPTAVLMSSLFIC